MAFGKRQGGLHSQQPVVTVLQERHTVYTSRRSVETVEVRPREADGLARGSAVTCELGLGPLTPCSVLLSPCVFKKQPRSSWEGAGLDTAVWASGGEGAPLGAGQTPVLALAAPLPPCPPLTPLFKKDGLLLASWELMTWNSIKNHCQHFGFLPLPLEHKPR